MLRCISLACSKAIFGTPIKHKLQTHSYGIGLQFCFVYIAIMHILLCMCAFSIFLVLKYFKLVCMLFYYYIILYIFASDF